MKSKTKKNKTNPKKEKVLRELSRLALQIALEDMRSGNEAPSPMLQLEAALMEIKFAFESR